MEKRQVRMQDGRYLIFYTFAETDAAKQSGAGAEENLAGAAGGNELLVKPEEEEEERSV